MKTQTKLFACLVPLVIFVTSCLHRAANLPRYEHVPVFTMIDQDGRSFSSSRLTGKVWIADFIYTTCPAACPVMTADMKRLSKKLDSGVELVSISVDPEHDTPAALKNFASHYDALMPQWTFLTGTRDTVHLLAWSTFHTGDVIDKVEHSTKFALVDRAGFIRGYYSSLDAEDNRRLLRDASALRQDNS